MRAWEGYAKSKGIGGQAESSLTEDDVIELRRMIDEHG
jgi:hypothetical protein